MKYLLLLYIFLYNNIYFHISHECLLLLYTILYNSNKHFYYISSLYKTMYNKNVYLISYIMTIFIVII